MSSDGHDEFSGEMQARILAAYGLKPWDAGLAPVPARVRIWRAATFAYRRGKAVDWRSYNAAEAEHRASRDAFEGALPGEMRDVADKLSEALPDGMRFEWAEPAPGDQPK